jgi:hypothetical protein
LADTGDFALFPTIRSKKMAVNSVTSGAVPTPSPPPPQAETKEATRNGKEVRDQDTDKSAEAQKAPPPETSPQGKMVGSLVDTKA